MQITAALGKYSDEFRQRAVRMVLDVRGDGAAEPEAVQRVADELSVPAETLQQWVDQSDSQQQAEDFDATTITEPDPYEAGVQLVEFGALAEAQSVWGAAAEADDTEAATGLGVLLEKRGDLDEAVSWYRTASEAGNTSAAYNLGVLLGSNDPGPVHDCSGGIVAVPATQSPSNTDQGRCNVDMSSLPAIHLDHPCKALLKGKIHVSCAIGVLYVYESDADQC